MPTGDPKKPDPKASSREKQSCGEGLADMFRDMDRDAERHRQAEKTLAIP